jgi:spoIIIJ-associated protein
MSPLSNKEIESRGVTVEAAVAAGLLRLGLRKDQVAVTVIDEGSRGLLGIGSREAVVRIAPLPVAPEVPVAQPAPRPPVVPLAPTPAPKSAVEPPAVAPVVAPAVATPPQSRPRPAEAPPVEADEGEAEVSSPDELEGEREMAVEVVQELLDKMRVSAQVSGYLTDPDDLTGHSVNVIDIKGEDLGILIGPRGETLDSLQFISRLMVSHKLHRRVNFVVDVEGFRRRREQALTRLAERMADKVRQRGEPIALEPMSAYERRIIHMTLRGAPDVYTESTGEGKQRRVRIFPKD